MKICTKKAEEQVVATPEISGIVNQLGARIDDSTGLYKQVSADYPQIADVVDSICDLSLQQRGQIEALKKSLLTPNEAEEVMSGEEKAQAILNGDAEITSDDKEEAIAALIDTPVVCVDCATEDTIKQGKYWVNKGKEGTHGKFTTKKAADAQRKAMFASGYSAKEGLYYDDLEEDANGYITLYRVHSDIDENNVGQDFSNEIEAVQYAKDNIKSETWVDKVVFNPETNDEEAETIWAYDSDEEMHNKSATEHTLSLQSSSSLLNSIASYLADKLGKLLGRNMMAATGTSKTNIAVAPFSAQEKDKVVQEANNALKERNFSAADITVKPFGKDFALLVDKISSGAAVAQEDLELEEEQDYMVLIKESLDEGFLEYRFRDEYQAYGTFDAAAKAGKPAALLDKAEDGWRILAKTPQADDYIDELNEQVSLIVIE